MFRAHRIFTLLRPARPRHPIVQALFAAFAICAFLVLLVVGAAVALLVMIVGALLRLFGICRPIRAVAYARTHAPTDAPTGDNDVIDGEFTVLRKPLHRITDH
jgi:fatty acid desaturase